MAGRPQFMLNCMSRRFDGMDDAGGGQPRHAGALRDNQPAYFMNLRHS